MFWRRLRISVRSSTSVGPTGLASSGFFFTALFIAFTIMKIHSATIIKFRVIVRKLPHARTAHVFLASARAPVTLGLPNA